MQFSKITVKCLQAEQIEPLTWTRVVLFTSLVQVCRAVSRQKLNATVGTRKAASLSSHHKHPIEFKGCGWVHSQCFMCNYTYSYTQISYECLNTCTWFDTKGEIPCTTLQKYWRRWPHLKLLLESQEALSKLEYTQLPSNRKSTKDAQNLIKLMNFLGMQE